MVGVGEIHALLEVGSGWRVFALRFLEEVRGLVNLMQAQATGRIGCTHQHHHNQGGTPVLHPVFLGGQAAEGMDDYRTVADLLAVDDYGGADHRLAPELLGQGLDGGGGDPGDRLGIFGGDLRQAVDEDLEGGAHRLALDLEAALEAGHDPFGKGFGFVGGGVPDQGLAFVVGQDAPVLAHQLRGIGGADQKLLVDQALVDQDLGHGQQHGGIGARADRHPLVGLGPGVGQPWLHRDDLHPAGLGVGYRVVEPARPLFGLEVVAAEVQQQVGVLHVGQEAVVAPGQLVGHMAGGLAGGGAVDHRRGAEGGAPGLGELVAHQVLAVAVVPDQLTGVIGLDLFEFTRDLGQGLVPRDLLPARVLVGPFLGVGPLERGLDAVGVVGIEGTGPALGADAVVVVLGDVRVGVDDADYAVFHLDALATEVHAVHAGGVYVLDALIARGLLSGGGRGSSGLGDDRQRHTNARGAGQCARAFQEATSGEGHGR